ncbi:MAG: UDP-N-acetylmuramoyl-tripeptide--D-alanyl-D-alanine ligase, partial [Gammaproteobacteria bacterium]
MIALALASAARVLDATLHGADARFHGVSTDTRSLRAGELFVALSGPRFDAHDMLGAAAAAGAAGAVVRAPRDIALPQVVVPDPRRALGVLARDWRLRFGIPVLGVTGSAGKTTVKEMLGAILAERWRTLVTRGNLNNDIGVPLTLFGLGPEHEAAVIEMGANRAGDIALLADIARPTVGLVTLCAPAHLEGFGDIDTVARTKGEIYSGLGADGIAIINAQDTYSSLWHEMATPRRVITFGAGGDVHAADIDSAGGGARFRLCTPVGARVVTINHRGRHNVDNALAAAAAACAAGLGLDEIAAGLAAAAPVAGRLLTREVSPRLTVIDDSYNANPTAMHAAIAVLAECPGTKWLVLGDMGELGAEAVRYHAEVGAAARAAGITRLYTLGPLATHAAREFGSGSAAFASDAAELIAALSGALAAAGEHVTVLVKGSRVMALERVTAA